MTTRNMRRGEQADRRAARASSRSCARSGSAYPNDFRRDALAAQLLASYGDRDGAWLEANPVRVQRRRPHDVQARHGQGELRQDRRSQRPDPAVPAGGVRSGAAYEAFKSYDIGDMVGAEGLLFRTTTGELSVRVESAAAAGEVAAPAARQVARRSPTPSCATASATSI